MEARKSDVKLLFQKKWDIVSRLIKELNYKVCSCKELKTDSDCLYNKSIIMSCCKSPRSMAPRLAHSATPRCHCGPRWHPSMRRFHLQVGCNQEATRSPMSFGCLIQNDNIRRKKRGCVFPCPFFRMEESFIRPTSWFDFALHWQGLGHLTILKPVAGKGFTWLAPISHLGIEEQSDPQSAWPS